MKKPSKRISRIENLPHVFDQFYRADVSRTRSSAGSGLGLAIAKQLVESHCGSIGAESPVFHDRPGQQGYGTKITLILPGQYKAQSSS
jgi:signal transduction histidine kinase